MKEKKKRKKKKKMPMYVNVEIVRRLRHWNFSHIRMYFY